MLSICEFSNTYLVGSEKLHLVKLGLILEGLGGTTANHKVRFHARHLQKIFEKKETNTDAQWSARSSRKSEIFLLPSHTSYTIKIAK